MARNFQGWLFLEDWERLPALRIVSALTRRDGAIGEIADGSFGTDGYINLQLSPFHF